MFKRIAFALVAATILSATASAQIDLARQTKGVLPPGSLPLQFQGNWSSTTTYTINQVVLYSDGKNYISLQNGNLNQVPPTVSLAWAVFPSGTGGVTPPASAAILGTDGSGNFIGLSPTTPIANPTTGNAATATSAGTATTANRLAATPTQCSGLAAKGIDVNGNAQGCFAPTATPAGTTGAIQYNNAGATAGAVLSGVMTGNGTSAPGLATAIELDKPLYVGTDTGTANAYAGCPATPITSYGTPSTGYMSIRFAIGNTNTAGSATVNICGLGVKSLVKRTKTGPTSTLAGADLVATQVYEMTYDGTNVQFTSVSLGSAAAVGGTYALQFSDSVANFNGSTNATLDPFGNMALKGALSVPNIDGNFYIDGYSTCSFGTTTFTRAADCAMLDAQKWEQANGIPAVLINDPTTEYFTEPLHENDTIRMSILGATRKISALQFLNTRTNAITLLTAGGYEDDAALNWGCATASLPNPIHLSDITLGGNQAAGMAVDIAASKIGSLDHVNFTGAAGTGDSVLSKAGSTNQLGNANCANTIATVKQTGALTGMTPGVYYVASTQCTGTPPGTGATGTDQAVLRFVISSATALDSLVVMHRGTGCPSNTTFTPPNGTGWNLAVNLATQGGDAEMYANDVYWIGQGNLPKQSAELMCGITSPTAPFCNVQKYPYTATISGTSLTITSKIATSSSSSDTSGYPIPSAGAAITTSPVFASGTTIATITTAFGNSYGSGTLSTPALVNSQYTTLIAGGQTYLAMVAGSNFQIIGSPAIINGSIVTGGGFPAGTTITAGSGSSFTTSAAGTSGSSVPVQIASGGVYQNVAATATPGVNTSSVIVYLNGYGPSLSGASGANDYAGQACSTNGGLNNTTTGSAPHFVQIPNSAGSITGSTTWTMDTVTFTGYSGCALDRSYPGIYAYAPDLSYPAYGLHEVSITDTQFNQAVISNVGRLAGGDNDNNGNTYVGLHPIDQQVGLLDRTGAMYYGTDGDSTIYEHWLKGSTTLNGLHMYHAPCADGTNSCFGGSAPIVIDTGAQAPNGATSINQVTLSSSDASTLPPDYHFVINVNQGPVDYDDAEYWPAGVDARNNPNADPRQTCTENGITTICDTVYDWGMNMLPQAVSTTGLVSPLDILPGDVVTQTLSTIGNVNIGTGVLSWTLPSATPLYTVASGLATAPLGTSVCTGVLVNITSVQATTGKILAATYASGGANCNVGNYLSVTQSGSTNDGMVKITAVTSGVPTAVAAVVPHGYSVGQSVAVGTVSSVGHDALFDITAVDSDGQATAINLHVGTILGTRTGGEYMAPDILVPQQTGGAGAAWPLTAVTVANLGVSGTITAKAILCPTTDTTCGVFSQGNTVRLGGTPTSPLWNMSSSGNFTYGSGNSGGTIGLSGTPIANGYFTALNSAQFKVTTGGSILFTGGTALTGMQGNGSLIQAAGTNSGTINAPHCNDANGNATTVCTNPWLATANTYTATQSGTSFNATNFRGTGANTSYGATGLFGNQIFFQGDDRIDTNGSPTGNLYIAPNTPSAWNSATTYGTGNTDNVTGPDGLKYHSIQAGNLNNTPASSPTFWTAYTVTSGRSTAGWDATYTKASNNIAAGTVVNCATSGTATFYPVEVGTAIKRVLVYQAACTGSATLTLASSAGFSNFAHTPFVTGSTTVTSTTTVITAAGGAGTTGYSEVLGN